MDAAADGATTATARWSAPGRVNLIGEHTDYNGGLALPFAIDLRTTATVRPRGDDLLTMTSYQDRSARVSLRLGEVAPGHPAGWGAYVAGVFGALRDRGLEVAGADVVVDGRVPLGAGLSSSAALECAVAAAAAEAFGLRLTPEQVADVAQEAESRFVGVPCGAMDQRTAMLARAGSALLLDFSRATATPVAVPAGRSIVVVDTRVRHALADGQYAERRRRCETAAQVLGVANLSEIDHGRLDEALGTLADERLARVVRHVVTENTRVCAAADALQAAEWATLGAVMLASHQSLRQDYEVSSRELDLAVDVLVREGADGARMTGGGFGGSVVALLEPASVEGLEPVLAAAFAQSALAAPVLRVVTPSAGAHAERSPGQQSPD